MPQTVILIACSSCRRPVHQADAEALGWRFHSDGAGELRALCALCVHTEDSAARLRSDPALPT